MLQVNFLFRPQNGCSLVKTPTLSGIDFLLGNTQVLRAITNVPSSTTALYKQPSVYETVLTAQENVIYTISLLSLKRP